MKAKDLKILRDKIVRIHGILSVNDFGRDWNQTQFALSAIAHALDGKGMEGVDHILAKLEKASEVPLDKAHGFGTVDDKR
jgi:hypothetical protein